MIFAQRKDTPDVTTGSRTMPPVYLMSPAERFGGAEVYMRSLATDLAERGRDVTLVCGTDLAVYFREVRENGNIRILTDDRIVWDWSTTPEQNIRRQNAAVAALCEHGDFVPFVNLNWLCVGCGILEALAMDNRRAAVHVHLCPHRIPLTDPERLIITRSIDRDAWSVVSADNRRFIAVSAQLSPAAADGIRVIYNGATNVEGELTKFDDVNRLAARSRLGLPHDRPILLSIGRHETQKGFEEALDVVRRLVELTPAILYVWVGGGTQLRIHREMVAHLGLSDSIHLLSERSDIADFFRSTDVFYMPTKYEGFGLAMLEASFYGVPTIMNDVSSAREFIPEGFESCLVPPLRTWEHVFRLHDLLSASEEHRREIGDAFQRQSLRFSRLAMFDNIISRIDQVNS